MESMRPITLLDMHQVGFIEHHVELRGHQVVMGAWALNGTRSAKRDQVCIK